MSGGREPGSTGTNFCFLRVKVEETQRGRSSQGRDNAQMREKELNSQKGGGSSPGVLHLLTAGPSLNGSSRAESLLPCRILIA